MPSKGYYQKHKKHILKLCKDYSKTKRGKAVHKKAVEKFRKNHPGIANEYATKYRNKVKEWINRYKLSKGCSVCGYNKCAFALDFHQIGDKKFSIGQGIACNKSLEKVKKEIEKCIVLCANCHRELHDKERGNDNEG